MDSWPAGVWQDPSGLLKVAVRAAEDLGVLVIQTRGVDPAEMQGFSISDWPYPVVALNGRDTPRRRLFTLLHELCHIATNTSGVCDLHEAPSSSHERVDEVERYCNRVAAAVLMPRERILKDAATYAHEPNHKWTLSELRELSKRYGASSEAVLIRLIGLGRAAWSVYEMRKPELDAEYERLRQEREERQQRGEGGPNYYVVKARSLGHGYIGAVLDAYSNRAISSCDVADYLDVRFDQIPELARRAS
jgi:Zn-dependent peptidase ImmA (M78 family)